MPDPAHAMPTPGTSTRRCLDIRLSHGCVLAMGAFADSALPTNPCQPLPSV